MAKKHRRSGGRKTGAIGSQPPANFRAFTTGFSGIANRIVTPIGLTPAFSPKDHPDGRMPYAVTQKKSLWDTGATGSVLTTATIAELNLKPIGTATVNHAGGRSSSHTYLVNFYLPNRVAIAGVIVTECQDIAGNFDAIIGMDIISRGDLAITNANGKTHMSFRFPSIETIDFVPERFRPPRARGAARA